MYDPKNKGITCNYIANMKYLVQVLIEKKINTRNEKEKNPNVWPKNPVWYVEVHYLWKMCAQFEISLIRNEEAMTKSQSPPKSCFLPQKEGHTQYLKNTMWRRLLDVTIPNMKALVSVLIQKS